MYQKELATLQDELARETGVPVHEQITRIDTVVALGARPDFVQLWERPHTRGAFRYFFNKLRPEQRVDSGVLASVFARESATEIKQFVQRWELDITKRDRANLPWIYHVLERGMDVVSEVLQHFREEIRGLSMLEYVVSSGLFLTRKELVRYLVYEMNMIPPEKINYNLVNKVMEHNLRISDYLGLCVILSG
jgi:hypothetical protein